MREFLEFSVLVSSLCVCGGGRVSYTNAMREFLEYRACVCEVYLIRKIEYRIITLCSGQIMF